MMLERAEIVVKPGAEEGFAEAFGEHGRAVLERVDGVRSVRWGRGVESPNKFLLLVEWASVQAHEAFSKSSAFTLFMGIVSPFTQEGAMEHFEMQEAG